MFKAGEKVIHHRFGEGVLVSVDTNEYTLMYVSHLIEVSVLLTIDGKEHPNDIYPSIYYKLQTLDMSKPEPAIGTWGYFWDDYTLDLCTFGKLRDIVDDTHKYIAECSKKGITPMYMNFSPEIPPHIKELMNGGNNE